MQPRNPNPFQFSYATKWSAYGMNYEKTPHHCAPGYRTFFDHFEPADFTWRPYLGLEDLDPTEGDMWSTTTFIICFTTVEMHNSDRVKLQFGIQQDIPGPPTCMEDYHKSKVIDQWRFENWKDHYKQERRQWNNRRNTVLQGAIMQEESKPTRAYMEWYQTASHLYLSQNRLLFDPRSQTTPSNFQHTTQQPTNPTQPPSTPSQNYNPQYPTTYNNQPLFNPTPYNTQQSFNPTPYNTQQQHFTPSTSYTQPHTSFNTPYTQQPFSQPTPQQHNFQTPQPQFPFFQSQSISPNPSQDQQVYVPIRHNFMPPYAHTNWNFEGSRLSYGSAATTDFLSDEMVTELTNPTDLVGPSSQPSEVPLPRRISRRVGRGPPCGTDYRLPRPGHDQHHD